MTSIKKHQSFALVNRARSLRVVHVVLSLDCGGLEHVVVDLARAGREAGQDVFVICLEKFGVLSALLEVDKLPVLCLNKTSGLQFAAMRRALWPLLAELHPDVVHTHQIGALFYAGRVARAIGVPAVVHTEHGKHFGGSAKTRWLGRIAAWHADQFFCVSNDIAGEVVRRHIAFPHKVEVIPNGIDTTRFSGDVDIAGVRRELGIPDAAPVIGTIGRLAEVKRQDLLLRAFATMRKNVPSAHLVIVGDGPKRNALERLASELGIEEWTHFTGYRMDRERLLRVMSLFTLTSRSEGMPLSVLEAWASGVPVIASAVGGLPEMISDGQTGMLIAGENAEVWAAGFEAILKRSEFAKRLTGVARTHVEKNHSLRAMLSNYESRYRAILDSNEPRCKDRR